MNEQKIMIDNIDVSQCEHVCVSTSLFKEKTYVKCFAFFLENEDSYCDCTDNPNCYFKQLKRKEKECEELRDKLNSNIKRMNEQNEKLHNEIQVIRQQMKTILMVSNNGKYKPVKNSTKEQCYQVLGNIQELLGTNIIRLSEVNNGTNP